MSKKREAVGGAPSTLSALWRTAVVPRAALAAGALDSSNSAHVRQSRPYVRQSRPYVI